jgi:hypothetical protein
MRHGAPERVQDRTEQSAFGLCRVRERDERKSEQNRAHEQSFGMWNENA